MPRSRMVGALAVVTLLAACAPSPSPTPSQAPSATPSTEQAGNLPPGCAPIELRAPSGERLVLDGTWTEVDTSGEPMTWWIRTAGNCVRGAGSIDDVPPEGTFATRPDQVQSLSGVLGNDLVITGEIIWLGALPIFAPGDPPRFSPMRLLIEFDDAGEVLLREDREPGVQGPLCPDPSGYCPAPLLLQRVD